MLKDRRVLLEHDLKIAQDEAAHMYFHIVVHDDGKALLDYQLLRDKVSNLQFDLDMVNKLIAKGAE